MLSKTVTPTRKTEPMPATITPTEHQMLKFTNYTFRFSGVREQMVREQFGMSMDSFWQCITRLLDRPEAEAACPVEVHRLRRLRDARQRSRGLRSA